MKWLSGRFLIIFQQLRNYRAAPRWRAEITQYASPPSTLSTGIAEVHELADTDARGQNLFHVLINNDFLGDCRIVIVFNLTDRDTPCSEVIWLE